LLNNIAFAQAGNLVDEADTEVGSAPSMK